MLAGGRIVGTYCKRELPNYQVFDERRYFVSGRDAGEEPLVFEQGSPGRMGVSLPAVPPGADPAAEIPAANGITNARTLARIYAATIGEVDGVRLLKPETVERARIKVTPENEPDACLIMPTTFGMGFMTRGPFTPYAGPGSYGHPGAGGSVAAGGTGAGAASMATAMAMRGITTPSPAS